MDILYRKGDLVEVTITDFAEKQNCFGKLDLGIGALVRGVLAPGDRISARIIKVRKRYIEAVFVELLQPSPDRVTPICGHFSVCGGCKLMHVSYPVQLMYKRRKLIDALEHLGSFASPPVAEVHAAPSALHYRNKIEFSFSASRYLLPEELTQKQLTKSKNFALGFHAPGNYEKIIEIEGCFLATKNMNRILSMTRNFALSCSLAPYSPKQHTGFLRHLVIRESASNGELMVNLVTSWHDFELMQQYAAVLEHTLAGHSFTFLNNVTSRHSGVAFGEEEFLITGSGVLVDRLGPLDFRISANSFFQTNSAQAEILYETILAFAELRPTDTVFDLYCGTGTITLYLARYCRQAIGLEVVAPAVSDARQNAVQNSISNALFFETDLKDFSRMQELLSTHASPRIIVTDPPRAGMHPKALQAMLQYGAERIIYVSCNPSSLARDGKEIALHGYSLVAVQPVDMFPHTAHIECVACFEQQHVAAHKPCSGDS